MKDDSASYFDSQEFQELLEMYENMLSEGSSVWFDSMDLSNLAEYYSQGGDIEKSDSVVEYGLRLHPQDPDILIAKASNLLLRGHVDEARVIAESIEDLDNQELFYLKGCIELASGNPETADVLFDHAVELSDEDYGMFNDIIVRFMDNRNYDLCQKWLDRALLLSPESRNFIELQADLFFDTGQMDTAIEWYNHLLDEFAYDTYYWDQLGRIYYEKGDYPKARECFEFIEAIQPDNRQARLMKASCIFSMEQWQEAYSIYMDLLSQDRNSYTLLYYCGRCLYSMEQFSQAMDMFQESFDMLRMDRDVPIELFIELYYYLSVCSSRTGQKDMARTYLYEGLAIDPDDEDLQALARELLPPDEASLFITKKNTEN